MTSADTIDQLAVPALIGIVVIYFVLRLFTGTAWHKGKVGERKVNSRIAWSLDKTQYQLIHDVTLPIRGGTTQIDHLVVSRFGVFVIETKNMSGWIFGGANQAQWTQVIFQEKQKFRNPLWQNYKHVRAVQELLDLDPWQVHNVVVFVGDCEFKTDMPPEVIKGTSALTSFIKSQRQAVIADTVVPHLLRTIQSKRMAPGRETNKVHLRNVEAATRVNETRSVLTCPRCGGAMIERKNKKTGQPFLGCSSFPKCRGVRTMP